MNNREEAAYEVGSQLFRPFRAVGFVCGNLPFEVVTQHNENHIITSIGKSIHTYTVCTPIILIAHNLQYEYPLQGSEIRVLIRW